MSQPIDNDAGAVATAGRLPSEPQASDDPRLAKALEEYLAAQEAGVPLDRQEFLARQPEIAERLAECLGGLELVQAIVPDLGQPGVARPVDSSSTMQLIDGQTLSAMIRGLRQHAGMTHDVAIPTNPAEQTPAAPATGTHVSNQAGVATERSTKAPAFFRTAATLGVQAAAALQHAHA